MTAECAPVLVWSEIPLPSEERGRGNVARTSVHGFLGSTVCPPSGKMAVKTVGSVTYMVSVGPSLSSPVSTQVKINHTGVFLG